MYKDWPQCYDADTDPESTRHRLRKRTESGHDNNIPEPSLWRAPDVPEYINNLEQVNKHPIRLTEDGIYLLTISLAIGEGKMYL